MAEINKEKHLIVEHPSIKRVPLGLGSAVGKFGTEKKMFFCFPQTL